MVQRGGTVSINVQNVTLLVCVATLVMVACVLFKTCVNEGFQGTSADELAAGQRLRLFTLYLANHTPYWQIIQIQLVPVVVAHCVVKLVSVLLA